MYGETTPFTTCPKCSKETNEADGVIFGGQIYCVDCEPMDVKQVAVAAREFGLSVKSVKVNKELSEETMCFTAKLMFKGKQVAAVSNRGCGGSNEYVWLDIVCGRIIRNWADAQEFGYLYDGAWIQVSIEKLDGIVGQMVDEHRELVFLRGRCKNNTLFRVVGDPPDTWRVFGAAFCDQVQAVLIDKFGDTIEEIANERAGL
jgi:hypothetical protein